MTDKIEIRESVPSDLASIERLYPAAFPDEDLLPLVKELLLDSSIVLSLVGNIDTSLAGHIIFTKCGIAETTANVALLGPLAIAPAWQRQGIGGAMIRAGSQRLTDAGVTQVFVLGDPAYYSRSGFAPDADVAPPYPLPTEYDGAWQSISLRDTGPPLRGKLSVPSPWLHPTLWGP
jgi:putative acetyltransferase